MQYLKNDKLTKIGVFYDGGYFSRVTQYYRYYERKARISIKGLHEFIRDKVMELEKVEHKKYCQIVDAHYFRGRFNAYDAAKRENQLLYDRIFDDILMYANVVTHYLPMYADRSRKSEKSEKGIDVWFALEAYELTLHKQFDVVVLITGDGDYMHLVKKLNTLGTRVMLLYWDLEFPPEAQLTPVRTNASLINEATYEVNMAEVMRSRKISQIVESMFIAIEEEEELSRKMRYEQRHAPINSENSASTPSNKPGTETLFYGEVIHIDHERGLGNIRSDDGKYPGIIFFRRTSEAFDRLEKGERVSFQLGRNEKGDIAVKVSLLSDATLSDDEEFRPLEQDND